jgi:hypothetical protein
MSEMTDVHEAPVDHGLPPWQFFLLCGMLGATAVVIVATGQSIANIIILSLTIVATSFVGLGVYRTLSPLVSQVLGMSARVAGGRTRAALEREKALVLRSIKELEFDFAMGKVSQADFDEMGGRLRRRAMGLILQLDASTSYREQIEREIAARVSAAPPTIDAATRTGTCLACGTDNDLDARFCKQCGTSLIS